MTGSDDLGDEIPSTGRSGGPADAIPGQAPAPGFLNNAAVALGHVLGGRVDNAVRGRHRRHLKRVHWAHALNSSSRDFADGTFPPRAGNNLEVLIDGSEALPRMAAEIATATSHVHMTGWFLSPELALSRRRSHSSSESCSPHSPRKSTCASCSGKESPDPRVPSLTRGCSRGRASTHTTFEDQERARLVRWRLALPPRKDNRDRRPNRLRWRHRPHSRRRRPIRHSEPPSPRRHRLARRGPYASSARPSRTSRNTSDCAGRSHHANRSQLRPSPNRPATSNSRSSERCPPAPTDPYATAITPSSSRTSAHCARPRRSSTSSTSSSGHPRSSRS